ncbi:inositol-3-phosphate synthase [Oceanicola sp. 22II-s10i]|uniref:inositol-3-phosphate synthase n=1 Tax=Oceanicola sp. 22II-s10i TaxID=1317116 RepID=UPI000B52552A|nr:inositol-3-phosphate synthase [Oceanicola sp. 22II-s10i]OWU86391.1 inositol-3-phosphate synthase [Oceanicola sp. 22II-s10i]
MTTDKKAPIRVAIAGVGNCASSLVQGVSYCKRMGDKAIGVSFPELGGYAPSDIEFVAAFDVDARKVGRPLGEAIMAEPNCTAIFETEVSEHKAKVLRGPDLDGVSAFMKNQNPHRAFQVSPEPQMSKTEVIEVLKSSNAEVLIIFLPVGSIDAVEFYAECALQAGVSIVNGIPVFIVSNPTWAKRFEAAGIPVLGDDFKAQFGATIMHRAIAQLADMRGVQIDRTYQLNVGGNTDFLNMMDGDRLAMKRESKTEAVQESMKTRLANDEIRVGPSDYVPWLNDRKVAYIRLEGRLFGGVSTSVEMRLEVEDSPNAAAEALAAIRCARIARDRGMAGPVTAASAFIFKHPPVQMGDEEAYRKMVEFADGNA